jgi:hypothetical protein
MWCVFLGGSAMTTDLAGILRETDLLGSVPTADLEAVAAVSRVRTFRRGQVVFTTGLYRPAIRWGGPLRPAVTAGRRGAHPRH